MHLYTPRAQLLHAQVPPLEQPPAVSLRAGAENRYCSPSSDSSSACPPAGSRTPRCPVSTLIYSVSYNKTLLILRRKCEVLSSQLSQQPGLLQQVHSRHQPQFSAEIFPSPVESFSLRENLTLASFYNN